MKENKMKTSALIMTVVVVHCVALGTVILNQGCRTTRTPEPMVSIPETKLPPAEITKKVPLPTPSPETMVSHSDIPSDVTEYIIQKGDSISILAARYGLKSANIIALNNIANPSMIRAGQRILLPGRVDIKSPKPVIMQKNTTGIADKVPGSDVSGGVVHVVAKGEYLSKIALNYRVKVTDIMKANNLSNDKILVGQKLKIPGSAERGTSVNVERTFSVNKEGDAPVDVVSPQVERETAQMDVPAITTDAVDSGKTHDVEDGDDLASIAVLWKVDIEDLKKLNNIQGDNLKPGQRLKIPVTRSAFDE